MILKSVRFHFGDGTWRESVNLPPSHPIDWPFLGDPREATAMTVTTELSPEEFKKYWETLND
jgi:hypothetical protein